MVDRGSISIILPESEDLYASIFSSEELADSFKDEERARMEYKLYLRYAKNWNYKIRYTDFSDESFEGIATQISREILLNRNPHKAVHYIGSSNPVLTLIGDSRQGYGFSHHPFHSESQVENFRTFGKMAIQNFGYCSTEGFREISRGNWNERLLVHPVTTGNKSAALFPELPRATMKFGESKSSDRIRFYRELKDVAEEYRKKSKIKRSSFGIGKYEFQGTFT